MIHAKRAETVEEFEILRRIRNSCREFMTQHTDEITVEEQEKWRLSIDENQRPYLFERCGNVVGYGLIRKHHGCWWVSGGLLPQHRHAGLGRLLFEFLTKEVPATEVWLEVRKNNIAGINTYTHIGYEKHHENDTFITMVRHKGIL